MRRLLAAIALLVAASPPAKQPVGGPVPAVIIDGKGFGHGVGMAQDGVFAMAKAAQKTEQILGQFYPGTQLARSGGQVRIPVFDAGAAPVAADLGFPDGGEVRGAGAGFPVSVPRSGSVTVVWDGATYRVAVHGPAVALGRRQLHMVDAAGSTTTSSTTLLPPAPTTSVPETSTTSSTTLVPRPTTTTSSTSTTTPSPTTTTIESSGPVSSQPVQAVPAGGGAIAVPARTRRYRGVVEVTGAGGTLRVVNQLDVEQYLKGMGEVRDPKWPVAGLRVQAIAARTYALRAMAVGGELCDTQRCQVYIGADAEYPAMNKAVDATAGQVLVFQKRLASAVYSSNGGGFSASREEGFGATGGTYPYLRAAPYPTQDPKPWNVAVALHDVGARLGYTGGDPTTVVISSVGPSGRAIEVTLDGPAGPKPVPGIAFARALGLRSTLFTLKTGLAQVTPLTAGVAGPAIQAPPEEAAAAVAAVIGGESAAGTSAPKAALPELPASPSGVDRDLVVARGHGGHRGQGVSVGLVVLAALALVGAAQAVARAMRSAKGG